MRWNFFAGVAALIFVQKIRKFSKISQFDRRHRLSLKTNRYQTLLHPIFHTGRTSKHLKFILSSSTSRKIAISYAPYFSPKTMIPLIILEIVSQSPSRHYKFRFIGGSRLHFMDFVGERSIFCYNLFNH